MKPIGGPERDWSIDVTIFVIYSFFALLLVVIVVRAMTMEPREPRTQDTPVFTWSGEDEDDSRYDESCGRTGCYGSDW